jgi:hypothetical protein
LYPSRGAKFIAIAAANLPSFDLLKLDISIDPHG